MWEGMLVRRGEGGEGRGWGGGGERVGEGM